MCEHRVFLVIATLKAAASYSGGREGRMGISILYMYIYIYIYIYIYTHTHTHMHVCIDIYICICMCVYRYVWICVSIYTHPYVHIHTHVCMCVSSRQCNGVLYQKPLSLHLLWIDLGLSHCAFPIHHPDHKLLLRMTHGSNPVTHSQLLTMNKAVSTVTDVKRQEHSPLVAGKVLPPLTESSGGRRPSSYIPSSACALKEPPGTFSTLLWCLSSKPKILRGKLPSLLWWWSYGEGNLPDTFLTFVCSSDFDIFWGGGLDKARWSVRFSCAKLCEFFNLIFIPLPLENNLTAISETLVWVLIIFSLWVFLSEGLDFG